MIVCVWCFLRWLAGKSLRVMRQDNIARLYIFIISILHPLPLLERPFWDLRKRAYGLNRSGNTIGNQLGIGFDELILKVRLAKFWIVQPVLFHFHEYLEVS